jgi:hypothetical protein
MPEFKFKFQCPCIGLGTIILYLYSVIEFFFIAINVWIHAAKGFLDEEHIFTKQKNK